MADDKKLEREELHRATWAIAEDTTAAKRNENFLLLPMFLNC